MMTAKLRVRQERFHVERSPQGSIYWRSSRTPKTKERGSLLKYLHTIRHWNPRSNLGLWIGLATLLLVLTGGFVYKTVDAFLKWCYLPRYSNRVERDFRQERFPSVEQRVRMYMTNWYLPPCNEDGLVLYERVRNQSATVESGWFLRKSSSDHGMFYYIIRELESTSAAGRRTLIVSSKPQIGRIFYLDETNLYQCYLQRHLSIRFYCKDSIASILHTAVPDIAWKDDLPLLCQFSDETESLAQDANDLRWQSNPNIPHIKKIRFVLSGKDINQLTTSTIDFRQNNDCHSGPREPPEGLSQLQPIIWLLNVDRHFKHSRTVPLYDIPWEKKADAAVFRGLLTGFDYSKYASDEENCENLIRCKLVFETAKSKNIDAKLTSTFNKMPDNFKGINLTGDSLRKDELLAYKGFIVLEGNDVSSSLKWAMVSKSVVLMPPPRFTSWSMEELLEPWVHYIPINRDLSDVEEKVLWMLNHQSEAQRISHRATLFVLDLYFHPDALKENRIINGAILQRFRKHFRPKTS